MRTSRREASLPFRICVIGAFAPAPVHATSGAPPLRTFRATGGTVDALLAEIGLALKLDVPDPFGPSGSTLRIDLRVRSLADLRPSGVVDQSALLRGLAEARALAPTLGSATRAEIAEHLARVLPVPAWVDALTPFATSANAGEGSAAMRAPSTPPVAAAAQPTHETRAIDALLSQVDLGNAAPAEERNGGGRPKSVPAPKPSGFSSLIAQVARGGTARPPRGSGALAERIDRGYRELLGAVLEHPELRRLERVWRGLRLLLSETKAEVELEIVPAEDLDAGFAYVAQRDPDVDPMPDLLVVSDDVSLDEADLARLLNWGSVAAQLRAPLVVSAPASQLLEDVGPALAAAASTDSASWVAVALNGGLVRPPWCADADAKARDAFEQDPASPGARVFAPPAFVIACLCARSFRRSGWPSEIVGPGAGTMADFFVHQVSPSSAIATERLVGPELADKAARRGLLALACVPNRDGVECVTAPTLATSAGGPTLPDQLFVARLAGVVAQLAAAIPEGTDPTAAQQAALIALAELFPQQGARAPSLDVEVTTDRLMITVEPRRFVGVTLPEITLEAALGR